MSRNQTFDHARDELFSHIHRCGVLRAAPEQQTEWLDDTVAYLGERYPELSQEELDELKQIGSRFCSPVIAHGKEHTALSSPAAPESDPESRTDRDETQSLAGAA